MLQFAFSLCHGENEKWADSPNFRRLKHEPVPEKAAKNVFAGVFPQIKLILFSSENRYKDSEPQYFRVVFSLYANMNKTPKFCCAFLFSFGLTFLRAVSQFSSGLPFAVDPSLRESPTPFFHG